MFEQALQLFQKAIIVQPNNIRWQLMVASCYRLSGNYQISLDSYKNINSKFPDNIECLRHLVKICMDLGMGELKEFKEKLAKLDPDGSRFESKDVLIRSSSKTQVQPLVSYRSDNKQFQEDLSSMLPE